MWQTDGVLTAFWQGLSLRPSYWSSKLNARPAPTRSSVDLLRSLADPQAGLQLVGREL